MGFPPYWYSILEAAKGDPLRAQEIESEINQEWWERYLIDRSARIKANKAKSENGE